MNKEYCDGGFVRIAHCRVLFCLLHHVNERTSRFIEAELGGAIGNIDSIVYICVRGNVK